MAALVIRALVTAIAPILEWRSARQQHEHAGQRHAPAALLDHLDSFLQQSELVRHMEMAGHKLRMRPPPAVPPLLATDVTRRLRAPVPTVASPSPRSPGTFSAEPGIRRRRGVGDIPPMCAGGRTSLMHERGGTSSADHRSQVFAVVVGHRHDKRAPAEEP